MTIYVVDSSGVGNDHRLIYLAGSFQGWQPGLDNWKMEQEDQNIYTFRFYPAAGNLEFKFTSGDWSNVETDGKGNDIPNREHYYDGKSDTIWLTIKGWADSSTSGSTAAENVMVWNDNYFMEALGTNRRIWIYAPPDYHVSEKRYPVLYMHDGQNVFDASTSYAGEWEVDETLNELFDKGDPGCIVVAIDNGGSERFNEYSPWENEQYGGGLGEAYVDFIVGQLKPEIDSLFRTMPERQHTGIMGSSMGGLISLYAGLEHPEIFGKVGSFSPAYWFSRESLIHAALTIPNQTIKIYTIAGELEGNQYLQNIEKMEQTLLDAGYPESDMKLIFHADGAHREWYWAREFKDAYLWLFRN